MSAWSHIDLTEAIGKVVRSEFSDADIEAVCAMPDWDEDGDRILRIWVVFKTARAFDAKKAKSLTHHIFPVLQEEFRDSFPVISFLSKADFARLSAAA